MIRPRFDLPAIARATEGFVGAELEAVVKDGMFAPFMDGRREIETEDLLCAAGEMVPLAKSHRDQIERPRQLGLQGVMCNASKVIAADEVKVEKVRGEPPMQGSAASASYSRPHHRPAPTAWPAMPRHFFDLRAIRL